MKIKVIEIFQDKFTGAMYNVNDILDFESKRADDLIKRGLAVAAEKPQSGAKSKKDK